MDQYNQRMADRGMTHGAGWLSLGVSTAALAGLVGLIAAVGCVSEEVGHTKTTTKQTTDTPTERTTVTEVHEKDTTLTPR